MTTNFLTHILAAAQTAGDLPLVIEVHGKDQRPTTAARSAAARAAFHQA